MRFSQQQLGKDGKRGDLKYTTGKTTSTSTPTPKLVSAAGVRVIYQRLPATTVASNAKRSMVSSRAASPVVVATGVGRK